MKRLVAVLALIWPCAALAETPLSCTAFTPTVSCNTATGEPVVTLNNRLAGSFDPDEIKITSRTAGVIAIASPLDPLALQLSGARAGDDVVLNLSAIATGAGAGEGLDKCCMGDVLVSIPAGFVCEVPRALSLAHICRVEPAGADALDVLCEISVHYAGPPPSEAAPLVLTGLPSGADWTLTDEVLASDDWACGAPAPDGTIGCKIDAQMDRFVDWRDFSSTLAMSFRTPLKFESCATAAIGEARETRCWSTDLPRLEVTKTAPESCAAGEVCRFAVTVRNPSGVAYEGPLSIEDRLLRSTPPTPGLGEFTAITPPLCAVEDLNAGLCAGEITLAAGSEQTYAIDWTPPDLGAGFPEGYSVVNCARVVSLAGAAVGDEAGGFEAGGFEAGEGQSCAQTFVPAKVAGASRGGSAPAPDPAPVPEVGAGAALQLVKTAAPCVTDAASQSYSCPFTLSVTNAGGADFLGPVALTDFFGEPVPQDIISNSADWSCAPNAQSAVCDTPNLSLAAGAETRLEVTLTLPGLAKGGSFTNCAALGLPPEDGLSERQAVAIVQRILLAQGHQIGRADGQAGGKTRAALAILQTELGVEPDGEIDAGLMSKLVNAEAFAQAPQSCVTVDLPVMPAKPLVCERATTVKASGVCQCRFEGMVRAGKTACGCAKGSAFVAGKGCVKVKAKPKTPTNTPEKTPTAPKQPQLRICPNGLPEVPGIGCVNIEGLLKGRSKSSAGNGCVDPTGLQCG